jgi:hypothetical protein
MMTAFDESTLKTDSSVANVLIYNDELIAESLSIIVLPLIINELFNYSIMI